MVWGERQTISPGAQNDLHGPGLLLHFGGVWTTIRSSQHILKTAMIWTHDTHKYLNFHDSQWAGTFTKYYIPLRESLTEQTWSRILCKSERYPLFRIMMWSQIFPRFFFNLCARWRRAAVRNMQMLVACGRSPAASVRTLCFSTWMSLCSSLPPDGFGKLCTYP